jgi:hypothetical protein
LAGEEIGERRPATSVRHVTHRVADMTEPQEPRLSDWLNLPGQFPRLMVERVNTVVAAVVATAAMPAKPGSAKGKNLTWVKAR